MKPKTLKKLTPARAVASVGEETVIPCTNPATGASLGEVPVDDPAAVRAAVLRAREAQRGWAETSFAQRRAVLRRLSDRILANTDALVDVVVTDAGKTREHALMGEIWPVLEKLRWTIANGEKHLRPERVSPGVFVHKSARLEFHPLGVVGAILPWNYPFQNLMNPIIPALMAGNACVVKPSEWVAWSAGGIIDLVRAALADEGHSPELVQLVQGYGPTGKALIQSGIDSLLFIGSVPNGRRILEAAAEVLVPVTLELGGKDPLIVCDDADLEQAVHAAMVGCFVNAGQNCVASERVLVFDGIYDRFVARAAGLVQNLRQGDPRVRPGEVDVGMMVSPMQRDLVERLVEDAVARGARLLAGGRRGPGTSYAPTLLVDVTPDMAIFQEETFGPVMAICRVHDEHEAVAIANGTPFALGSSVFSKDLGRARRLAGRLQAGMTAINEFGGTTYMAQDLPFGGVKHSGYGRMSGREGLRAFTNIRAVLDDRLPLHFASPVFPVGPADYARVKAAVELMYGRGRARLEGAKALLSGLFK